MMTYLQAEQYLDSFINYEFYLHKVDLSSFRLQRIEHLLKVLGSPQKNLRFIHIAGSKGKGSTCVFVASILKAAGLRVGLYTSPHLLDFRERIRILDGSENASFSKNSVGDDLFLDCIAKEDLCALVGGLHPTLELMRATKDYGNLTYFEVLTTLAFVYFAKKRV
ncbi:MAG: hypothetical protein NUV91_10040, partial [Candidatus Omnitrophica bacterium]|nr:hypothetical protein [Candidatus Omnitrophota bacterium]